MVCSLTRAGAKQAARAVDLPAQQVGTLHSIIYHAVGCPNIAEGKIREWNAEYARYAMTRDSATIDDPFGRPFEQSDMLGTSRSGDDLKMAYAKFRTLQIPMPEYLQDFATKWEDWKSQCNYIDFIDLIEMGLHDLDCAPGKPAVLMLDEGQDVGPLEMAVLRKWAPHTEHFVIAADYHQALFSFRGGDAQVITNMIDSGIQPRILEQSYRIPRAVHKIAMRWMKRTKLPEVVYYPRDYEGAVKQSGATYRTGEDLLAQIERYMVAGKTVMLLTTCNYMLEPLLQVLQKRGLAYHNPWRPNNGRWNPLAPRRGTSFSERVLAFLRPSPEVWGEQSRFWAPADLKIWASALPAEGVFQPSQKAQVERCPEGMSDVEVARQMRSWFLPEALDAILKLDANWYCEQAKRAKGAEVSKPFIQSIVKHRGANALRERPLITVSTVHGCKGGESEIVFVFPDVAPVAYYGGPQARDELARVFYVACTRSREELILCSAASAMAVNW